MSKTLPTPTSRLICFGGAKAGTNSVEIGDPELNPKQGFGE